MSRIKIGDKVRWHRGLKPMGEGEVIGLHGPLGCAWVLTNGEPWPLTVTTGLLDKVVDAAPPDPDFVLASPHLSQREKEQALADWLTWKLNETAAPASDPCSPADTDHTDIPSSSETPSHGGLPVGQPDPTPDPRREPSVPGRPSPAPLASPLRTDVEGGGDCQVRPALGQTGELGAPQAAVVAGDDLGGPTDCGDLAGGEGCGAVHDYSVPRNSSLSSGLTNKPAIDSASHAVQLAAANAAIVELLTLLDAHHETGTCNLCPYDTRPIPADQVRRNAARS